jgi:uncharacterized membrane protein YfcA
LFGENAVGRKEIRAAAPTWELAAGALSGAAPYAVGAPPMFPGGVASAWAYRDGLEPVGNIALRPLLLTTLFGGAIGAILLLWTSSNTFDFVLPWLLLLATLALAFGRPLGELLRNYWRIGPTAVLIVQFSLGIYGGYFGGAVGIMMMAVWGLLDSRELKALNAPRTLLVSVANTIAVMIFVAARAIHWPETIAMLIAASVGGYGGALIGRRAPPGVVRCGTLLLTAGITLTFFVRAYL